MLLLQLASLVVSADCLAVLDVKCVSKTRLLTLGWPRSRFDGVPYKCGSIRLRDDGRACTREDANRWYIDRANRVHCFNPFKTSVAVGNRFFFSKAFSLPTLQKKLVPHATRGNAPCVSCPNDSSSPLRRKRTPSRPAADASRHASRGKA